MSYQLFSVVFHDFLFCNISSDSFAVYDFDKIIMFVLLSDKIYEIYTMQMENIKIMQHLTFRGKSVIYR